MSTTTFTPAGRRRLRRIGQGTVALLAAGALAAGCSSSADTGGATGTAESVDGYRVGLVNQQGDDGDPVRGGTLVTGTQLLVNSLDPVATGARGGSGGEALALVYDVLMQYDVESGEFSPKLADTLEANDDYTEWTLTLRDGVKFSDGTDLDADAVVASIERYNAGNGNGASLWNSSVDETVAVDDTTVKFSLSLPWQRFPSMLALGHGMIVAPSAGDGEDFTPIGAGPFTHESFNPGEEHVFVANPDYFDGEPYLDQITMVAMNGPQANLESLQSGQLDIAYIRGLGSAIHTAIDEGYPGLVGVLNAGGAELINNRDERPGNDVRVRQAIAHAIDPDLIDERVEEGQGLPGSELFGKTSTWHTDEAGPDFDPDKARELLDEAKADGYDGTLGYVVLNEPKDFAIGQTVSTLLEAVGFEVDLQPQASATDLLGKVYADHDFDLAHAGIGLYESIIDLGLESTTFSTSPSNIVGYSDEQMDELILELQQATDDEAPGIISQIQQRWNETVPSAVVSAMPSVFAWQHSVHGVQTTATDILLYDKVWIED